MKLNWRKITSFAGSALAAMGITCLISGCASTGKLARMEASYPKDKVNAPGLFVENCAGCHGKNGSADTFHGWLVGAQNLTSPKWQATSSEQETIHAIKTGPGAMPAFEKELSQAEIEALAAYVETFKPAKSN